ncbi:lysophospholipid acyltransferase family protein [Saccharicrinis aurantiacus]|uniref:lysophospholipid acyltransferase family protein n=1 Tax=Saccharicrinis aurantiacus TaxID=1849719 RepID=UPI002490F8B3|nr:lysophospholipid acyltransferase family protein [Saccharicrinis aurantiacus]
MKTFIVHIGILLIKLIGHLPFWAIYFLSDIFYLLVRLIGYRKEVIFRNLRNAFPEKSEKEISEIAKKFYKHLCDLFFETFKVHAISNNEMAKRMKFHNTELLDKFYDEGKDVIIILGHYGNWEWVPFVNGHIKALGTQVYHPLRNKPYDKFLLNIRSKWGTLNFPMKTCFRDMLKLRRDKQHFIIGMIADQSPAKNKIQYYTKFFNQEVPVLLGAEKMAVKTNSPVAFLRVDKVKRGYYEATFELLVEHPKECEEFEITKTHTQHLENIIKQKPEYWLWSHDRWKHKK